MFSLIPLLVVVLLIVAMWKVFAKAGQPGWAAIVPIYNAYILLKIAGKPGWWLVLMFIPLVNLIVAIIATAAVARKFGQGTGFVVGMILLPIVFYPILGFGSAQYNAQA
jgi:hypothetical protein